MRLKMVVLVFAVAQVACVGGDVSSQASPNPESAFLTQAVSKLETRRVFFGHQSVGANILEGVTDILRERRAIKLRIAEVGDRFDFAPGVIAHAKVGVNGDPDSKLSAFEQYLDSGLGEQSDVAVVKMCYLDVEQSTDVDALFRRYRTVTERISAKYPRLQIVHVTVPLQTVQTGPKAWLKRLLGRVPGGYAANARRNKYNDLVRRQFQNREALLDLAAIEATQPDGGLHTFEYDGDQFLALAPPYAADAGHLNERGRRIVAEKFLEIVADPSLFVRVADIKKTASSSGERP